MRNKRQQTAHPKPSKHILIPRSLAHTVEHVSAAVGISFSCYTCTTFDVQRVHVQPKKGQQKKKQISNTMYMCIKCNIESQLYDYFIWRKMYIYFGFAIMVTRRLGCWP